MLSLIGKKKKKKIVILYENNSRQMTQFHIYCERKKCLHNTKCDNCYLIKSKCSAPETRIEFVCLKISTEREFKKKDKKNV